MNVRRAIALLACLLPAVILAAGCGQSKPADPTQFKAYDPKVKPLSYDQAHNGMGRANNGLSTANIPPAALARMSGQISGLPPASKPH